MSEDDDERMDRARRIRELREGGRRRGSDDEASNDTDADPPADESNGSDHASADTNGASEQDGDGASDASGSGEPSESADTDTDDDRPEEPASDAAGDDDEATTDSDGTADDTQPETDDPGEMTDEGGTDTAGDADVAEETPDAPADDAEEPEGALAAAQAAAAAASEFEGEGGVTMDPEEAVEETANSAGEAASDEETTPGTAVAGATVEETDAEETRVLEFRLGDELYCLDIEYVEEIVREETVTRVPNTPEYVSGVVDLRGQITTILDPKTTIGMERDDADQLIVVFDAETFDDHGAIGWLVDEVNQVTPIVESEVKESPIQEHYINGVIERDDKFVIWTTPELALDIGGEE